ncbi:beta-N-acetylhexosaminidase [Streptomyces uncialis]|uniref:beta-N-acetylhexosaminidase n=1 Tax=Streptomyces uncialis TaxID=1048205 RepID=UPI00225A2517|nr:beta-N-acetylhexosaminidase [Streptomyces uncialis]MCX4664145.1 beta-N-acetylhexosaminidase [Streptomyces uncialis]
MTGTTTDDHDGHDGHGTGDEMTGDTVTDTSGTGAGAAGSAAPDGALLPAPLRLERTGEVPVALHDGTLLVTGPGTEGVARWLRAHLGAATGLPLGEAPADSTAPVADPSAPDRLDRLALAVDPGLPREGYRLTVAAPAARIEGGSAAGVFYGAQSLRQLLGADAYRRAPLDRDRTWTLPRLTVEDAPRFGWRGMMLDVSRHFTPKDGVLRHLDLLAAHKLNVFHFHLTDDQGWRVEIKRYPKLTQDGAWRSRTKWGHRASPLWDDKPHGGFYTQEDIREIVAYAAERHIRVIPEIDVPGHSQAAITAYPELGNTDVVDTASLSVWDNWGVSPNVLAPTDNTLRFFEGVLEEVLELFPADHTPFIHMGGDECPKDQWKESPAAQARIKELGLRDEDELQSWFIRHFDTWLSARGRRLIGWDEILEGGLAPGAVVSSWRGYGGGITAARAGHDVIMCPEQQVYLDHRQSGGADEPVPIGFVRTLEDVYRFEPVPPELTPEEARHVLGTQANVWTEVMEGPARVDYQVYPRLAAFAEVAWSALPASADRDFDGFEARMTEHYRRLDALGVQYRPPTGPLPWQRRPGLLGRPIDGAPPNV